MINKVLYCGDPHAKPDCLDEMARLVDFICRTATENEVDAIVLLGDQFHTHSIIHLNVLAFWRDAFKKLCDSVDHVYVLVGNHDMSGRVGDTNNAMMLFHETNLHVVDYGMTSGPIFMVPYCKDPAEFIKRCAQFPNHTLVCHQTFVGSVYENGFPAKDGVDPNLIPQKHVISGHIHTPQAIGKVWYPGCPRWQTIADANVQRAIWIVDHDTGMKQSFATEGVCRPIFTLTDRPDEPVVLPSVEATIVVDVYGSEQHVKARTAVLEKEGVRVRPFPTLARAPKVKESDGLPKSFTKFIAEYKPKFGTDKKRLLELAGKRISWMKNNG